MANRSYIYLIKNNKSTGIGECNYNIPITFKILVSSNTKLIKSKIFQANELIALQGDFNKGKEKLYEFLDTLLSNKDFYIDGFEDKISQTKQFFRNLDGDYIYLDCTEIFEMENEPLEEQNKKLFNEINNIETEIKKVYENLKFMAIKYNELKNKLPYKGLFEKNKNEKANKKLDKIKQEIHNTLFLDCWSNVLYYDIKQVKSPKYNQIRDKIKDRNYFKKYISTDTERIRNFQLKLNNNEVKENRINTIKNFILQIKLNIIIASYSNGEDIKKIRIDFIKFLDEWLKMKEVEESYAYSDFLTVISLSILLNINEYSKKIKDLLIKKNIKDWLLDYLLDPINTNKEESLLFNEYKALQEVVYQDNKIELLKNYMKNWYNLHKDSWWYESHKSTNDIYIGYWSFEAAAVAKILKLPNLEDIEYYPFDLVEF